MPKAVPCTFLRVELLGVQPLIWRRVRVAPSTTLETLHTVLQIAMGWNDTHAHQYRIGRVRIGAAGDDDSAQQSEADWSVAEIIASGAGEFLYEYDFGDLWLHRVVIEPAAGRPVGPVPTCLAGEGACPPDDIGGPTGYRTAIAALADPEHRAHAAWAEWLGEEWDPQAFDLAAINRALRRRGRG
jgi:hypothetical protein